MNQFKKAKRDRVNSGKPIEKASDLTTAGTTDTVAPEEDIDTLKENLKPDEIEIINNTKNEIKEETNDNELKIEPELTITEEVLKTKEDISPIKEEIELPVEAKLDTSDTTVSNPKETVSSQPELIPQVKIPKPVAPEMVATIPEEQQVQPEFPSESVPVAQKIVIEPEPKPVILESTYVQEMPPIQEQPIYHSVPHSPVQLQPQMVVPQAIVQSTQMQQVQAMPVQTEPIVMPIQTTGYPIIQEPVVAPVVKEVSQKKTAPNIFHNKGESKSVRKSLVLKPTSVKIAENYCSKNGGSFNELIQHLLDNFIDEYGLR